LPHYSTDTQYSLEKVSTDSGEDVVGLPRRVIELGLGDDFDASFGEALRKGIGGEEISLGKEALRVLSESQNTGKLGKQGRKGSIGMGLFRESRAAAAAGVPIFQAPPGRMSRTSSEKKKRREEAVVMEEAEEEHGEMLPEGSRARSGTVSTIKSLGSAFAANLGGVGSAGGTSYTAPVNSNTQLDTPSSPRPIRSRRSTHVVTTTTDEEETRSPGTGSAERFPIYDEVPTEEDSGWTTSSGTSSSASESDEEEISRDERAKRSVSVEDRGEGVENEIELETTDVDSEEESMTVPLQPFNHAVGGHSSIYKFTRRAVCKVCRP